MQTPYGSENKAEGTREIRKHEDVETSLWVTYILVRLRCLSGLV
jgi:hypothetical protein